MVDGDFAMHENEVQAVLKALRAANIDIVAIHNHMIGESPRFLFVPSGDVLQVAKQAGAIPYDVPGVELSHVGEHCGFDAFLQKYALTDPALARLALIVRGADTSRPDLAPEVAGLLAISVGLSYRFRDDHEMLGHGLVVYDALYAWCVHCQSEARGSPAKP